MVSALVLTHTQCEETCGAEDFKRLLTVEVGDDVQTVEQLSLVLMDSLDLNVEHGVGVDLHLVVLLQVHGELQLVFLRYQNIDFIT